MIWTSVPRPPLTEPEVVHQADIALATFPHIARRLSSTRIARSMALTWPDPPAPLIYWLWVAGNENFIGVSAARQCLQSLEIMLALLENANVTVRSRLDLAGAMSQEAWERLPERCIGILVCFTTDVLLTGGPLMFLPAPGRGTLDADLHQFLMDVDALW